MDLLKTLMYCILLSSLVWGCKGNDDLVSFNLETKDRILIPVFSPSLLEDNNPGNDEIDIISDEIRLSNQKKFADNHTDHADVEDVQAFDLVVQIDSGYADFSFGKNFFFYLSPSGQYFNDLELASMPYAENGKKVYVFSMKPTTGQWIELFHKGIYRLRLKCTMLKGLTKPVHVSYSMKFRLKAIPND